MPEESNYNDCYTVRATDLSFTAIVSAEEIADGSTVILHSAGSGEADMNGYLLVHATGQLDLQCGSAIASLLTTEAMSKITVTNGTPGKILFSQGGLPVSPRVEMKDEQILIAVGPDGAGASATLKPTELTLAFAAWKLTLDATGISLKVGPTSMALKPNGIELNGATIDLKALAKLGLEGIQVAYQAGAMIKAQGAVTMQN